MPEWSKGCDSSSHGFGRVGSNPTGSIRVKPLLHIAIEFVEALDNTLAEHQMLNSDVLFIEIEKSKDQTVRHR